MTHRLVTIQHFHTGETIYSGPAGELSGKILRDANLTALDLSGLSLADVDFTGAMVRRTNFKGAMLDNVNFTHSSFHLADFRGAELVRCRMQGSVVDASEFGEATLVNCQLTKAVITDTSFRGADMFLCRLDDARIRTSNFRGAKLHYDGLRYAELGHVELGDATLHDDEDPYGRVWTFANGASILRIGPIGSRGDKLLAFATTDGIVVRTGCFIGTIDDFARAVKKTHGDGFHARQYAAAIAMVREMEEARVSELPEFGDGDEQQ
jgi:hypothetical protein